MTIQTQHSKSNIILLFILGILWSLSTVFAKISVPVIGSGCTAFARVSIGASCLWVLYLFNRNTLHLKFKENLKHYAIVGLFNTAIPFFLFAFSMNYGSVGLVAIMNGTAPIWAIIISMTLKHCVSKRSIIAVIIGFIGVCVLASDIGSKSQINHMNQVITICIVLLATSCYGIAAIYIKQQCRNIDPIAMATCSTTFASLFLLPFCNFSTYFQHSIYSPEILSLFGYGILSTGLAYYLYYRIASAEGPVFALSVTFLIPPFGILMGIAFFGEKIYLLEVVGTLLILISMKMITGLKIKDLMNIKK